MTAAIGEAEEVARQLRDSYRLVSALEQEIAERLPADSAEGAMARRGAVRAAHAAHDHERAVALAQRFGVNPDAPCVSHQVGCDACDIPNTTNLQED